MSNQEWIYVSESGVIQPIAHMTDGRLVDVYQELLSRIERGDRVSHAMGDPVRMLGAMRLEMQSRGVDAASERRLRPA